VRGIKVCYKLCADVASDECRGSNRNVSFEKKNTKDTTYRNGDKTLSESGYILVACTGGIEGEFHFALTPTGLIAFCFFDRDQALRSILPGA
jgi:hypothetical protein